MFKQVTYNTYIGKGKLNLIRDHHTVDGNTKIGDIAYPVVILDQNRDNLKWPDYYLMGLYISPTEEDPANIFQIVKPYEHCIHHLYITGIPKGAKSLNPFRLQGCIWSSYYEDNLHGFLFQIVRSDTILKLQEENETIS